MKSLVINIDHQAFFISRESLIRKMGCFLVFEIMRCFLENNFFDERLKNKI